MEYSEAQKIIEECEKKANKEFAALNEIALENQKRVLDAFRRHKISAMHFHGTTGYGYDDVGRDTLAKLFADVFGTESAIVSPLIANGTHALSLALFGLLSRGDTIVSIAGKPYDTLDEVINGENIGSLKDIGVGYGQVDMTEEGEFDKKCIKTVLMEKKPKVVFIQRSKGYLWRDALSVEKIAEIICFVREISPFSYIVVDNCYGEFTEKKEPTHVGADVCIGSLIKNAGGGIAPTGAYICGKNECIDMIARRFTAPSLGLEVGSYLSGYLPFYQGLFLAPSTVKNALMGNVLSGYVFEKLGFETMPKPGGMPYDIIKSIRFNTAEQLVSFVQRIQKLSPVDSYVTPEPWDMPGYTHPVVMAAGTFVQGASLELSADGTVREPFVAYMQGGLTYEHCKLALTEILAEMG